MLVVVFKIVEREHWIFAIFTVAVEFSTNAVAGIFGMADGKNLLTATRNRKPGSRNRRLSNDCISVCEGFTSEVVLSKIL